MARGSSLPRRLLSRMALAVGALLLLPYAFGPVYSFPEPAPFAGPVLHNPYEGLTGSWQRANLHAHGSAWGGMTSGNQPATAVVERYRDLGYSVPGVSNYHHIAAHDGVATLPLYEHGINLGKYHQLAIGARAVEWFDFPLWQSLSHRQYVIDRVKRKAALVSLNHPDSRDAYGNEALRHLTGYDMIEVANGPFTTEGLWDEALSSGHLVWAVANDDTHDLTDPRRMAVAWNMVGASSASDTEIIDALRAGRFYAVLRTGAIEASDLTRLEHVDVHGDTMRVTLAGAPATISFVGQDGAIRQAVDRTTTAGYTFTEDDTYVRVVVHAPQTTLFLNPVSRWDGRSLPIKSARVDTASTWTFRGTLLVVAALLVTRRRRSRIGVGALANP